MGNGGRWSCSRAVFAVKPTRNTSQEADCGQRLAPSALWLPRYALMPRSRTFAKATRLTMRFTFDTTGITQGSILREDAKTASVILIGEKQDSRHK